MPFQGDGSFARVHSWTSDAAAEIDITASRMDEEDDGFAEGLSNCIARDGQSTITGDISLGSHSLKDVADPLEPQDAMTLAYADEHYIADVETIEGTRKFVGAVAFRTGNVADAIEPFTANTLSTIRWGVEELNEFKIQFNRTNGLMSMISTGSGGVLTARLTLNSTGQLVLPGVAADTTAASANMVIGLSGQVQRSTSSLKYKQNVLDLTQDETDAFLSLRPVTYQSREDSDGSRRYLGLIAEEAHETVPQIVGYDAEGAPDSVMYDRVVVGLLALVQRLETRVAALEAAVNP